MRKLKHLSEVLKSNPRTSPWAENPRLYAVLHLAGLPFEDANGKPFVNEGSLADGLDDYSLPYSEDTLPRAIKERHELVPRVLTQQAYIYSDSDDFMEPDKYNHHAVLFHPFEREGKLGEGSFGIVDLVHNIFKPETKLARKTIDRQPPPRDLASPSERRRRFRKEVEILRQVKGHEHVVSLLWCYTSKESLNMIFSPAAQETLEALMDRCETVEILQPFFGCLAQGLTWLHDDCKVRHRDIKPANILFDGRSVRFCDFGSAIDMSPGDASQTSGEPSMVTDMYKSPEAGVNEPNRGESSDIWSLGCVFLELASVLHGRTPKQLRASLRADPTTVCYFNCITGIRTWMAEELMSPMHHHPQDWISDMVSESSW